MSDKINIFLIINKLNESFASSQAKINNIKNNDTLKIRCETLLVFLKNNIESFKDNLVRLEQDKGIKKGIQICIPVINELKEVYKKELESEEDKLKFAIEVLQRSQNCLKSMDEKQKNHIINTTYKFHGALQMAQSVAKEIDKHINNYNRQLEKEEMDEMFSDKDGDIDSMIEERNNELSEK